MKTALREPATRRRAYTLPIVLTLKPALDLSDEQLYLLCQINDALRIERTATGEITLMPPASGGSGRRNADVTYEVVAWSRRDGTGVAFDSSTGYTLPNGAMRSPDASWVLKTRLEHLSARQWDRFLPLCPDFVVELRSPSDSLRLLKAKMEEWLANGARLGWLIDPARRHVYVY